MVAGAGAEAPPVKRAQVTLELAWVAVAAQPALSALLMVMVTERDGLWTISVLGRVPA